MNTEMADPYRGALVMVVEYLESSMSRDLLCKFPDNSAFDFDYSRSSIWSPLIPRPFPSSTISTASKNFPGFGISKKLVYDDGYDDDDKGLKKIKNVTAHIGRMFNEAVFDNLERYRNLKKRKRRNCFDFSAISSSSKLPSTGPTARKGWAKKLKTASNHFKKMKKKNAASIAQINFSS